MAAEGIVAQKRKAEEILGISCSLILDSGVTIKPWPSHSLKGPLAENWSEFETNSRRVRLTNEPVAFSISIGVGFIIPLKTSDSQGWYLAGIQIDGTLEALKPLLTAANIVLEQMYTIEQQQIQLDASAMQIARTFEEQCWLRELTKHLGLCRSNNSVQQLAAEILQPLRSIANCRQIALVVAEKNPMLQRFDLVTEVFGEGTWQVEDAEVLIRMHQSDIDWVPFLGNMLYTELPSGLLASYVIVPVGEVGNPFAYLIALERLPPPAGNGLGFMYDPEFGSFEVGLMEEASALLSTQAHNIRLFAETQQLVLGTLRSMTRAIDARDSYTQGHSERVAKLAFELARQMSLPESTCQEIYLAGILHDIGKIGVPDGVLLKTGPLTEEEFEVIKLHPVIGFRIIEQLAKLDFTLPGILHHHERWDGRGYPDKLVGSEIPLMARILAVADSFDAMTSSRPYRQHMPLAKAKKIISEGAGTQWDPEIVEVFLRWVESKIPEVESVEDVAPLYESADSMWESVSSAVLSLNL